MSVRVEYKNIAIGTIADENVEKCVELRESQSVFFFGEKPNRADSEKWIRAHRDTEDDVLYQIVHKTTGVFLGTIGAVRCGNESEVGRIAVYAPGVYQLIKSGETHESIGKIGIYACISLLRLLWHTQDFVAAYAEVLADNALSNKLCKEECGTVKKGSKQLPNGEMVDTFIYRMTKQEIWDKYGHEEMDIFLT